MLSCQAAVGEPAIDQLSSTLSTQRSGCELAQVFKRLLLPRQALLDLLLGLLAPQEGLVHLLDLAPLLHNLCPRAELRQILIRIDKSPR